MKLKSLEMQGFKSFPDKTRINFDAGMTAVIGPNGSGKSNISDAVRWVLGEMSVKGLRGSKMEDIIFSGSKGRPPANCASVSLYLSPDGEDGEETVVTRKYYRGGESEYYLNKKQVRLKDVYERFYDTGIGREGYSVIGQSKIEEVLSKKSEERRSIFEEAAGISKFRYRKSESERKLAATEDNLQRIHDIMGEIESRLGPLEKEAENAKKYLRISEEKRGLEISLWLNKIDALKDELSKGGEKLNAAQSELDAADAKIKDIESGADALYISGSEISRGISLAEKEISETELKITEAEGEKALKRNDISHFQKLIEDSRAEAENFGAEAERLDEAAAEAGRAEKAASCALETAKQKYGEKLEKHSFLRKDYEEKRGKAVGLRQSYSASLEKRSAAAASLAAAKAALENAERTAEVSAGEMSAFKDNIVKMRAALQALQKELETAEKSLSEAVAEQNNAALELRSSDAELEKLKEKRSALAFDLASLRQRRENLLRMEELLEGYSDSVKNVLNAAESGKIRAGGKAAAIYGTVSSVLSTDEKYAPAMETALGGAVQHLIVEREEDAKACIAYLKETRGGRASFLPVSAIRAAKVETGGLKSCEGFLGLGCELCAYDAKYAGIFERLLGDTAVCTDIDSASRIAKKCGYRLRAVTLDGQVIHKGGSFTGGSPPKRAGILTRNADIEKSARAIERKQSELSQTEKALEDRQAQSKALSFAAESAALRLAALKSKRDSVFNSVKLESMRLSEEERRCERLAEERGGERERLSQLETAAGVCEAKLKEADGEAGALSGELAALERETELAEKAAAASYDEAAKARLETADRENALVRCGEKAKLAAERRKALDRRAEACRLSAENAENRIEQRRLEIKAIEAKQLEYSEGKGAILERIARLTQGKAENERESAGLRNALREAQAEKEEAFRGHAALQSRLSLVSAEYDEYAAKLWEEYELTYTAALPFRLEPENMKKAPSRLSSLKTRLRAMGSINVNAVEEYAKTKERYDFLKAQTDDLDKTRKKLNSAIEKLEANMKNSFSETFARINAAFSEVFSELFGGGTAKCLLVDEGDVLGSEIDIIIRPPGKSIKNINLLSSGEQSFAAVALYLALQKINPAPFCIFDEIEAALDEVNVNILADYLKRHSESTQFIMITHRRGMMERADLIYGITMREKGVSDYIRLDIRSLEKSED